MALIFRKTVCEQSSHRYVCVKKVERPRGRMKKPRDRGPRADNCVIQERLLGAVRPRLGSSLSALRLRGSVLGLCSWLLRSSYLQGFLFTFDGGSLVGCFRFVLDCSCWSTLRLGCLLTAARRVLCGNLCLDRLLLGDRRCDSGLGLRDAGSLSNWRCLSGHRA